jgi:hypothetical protein
MPPTMAFCAVGGVLTPRIFSNSDDAGALSATATVGLLLGILVDFRIANTHDRLCRRFSLTLIANAGSPFSTAYAGADAAPPRFDLSEMGQNVLFYLRGNQGVTLLLQ